MSDQIPMDVIGAVSVWFEAVLYGFYGTLFFESLYVIINKKKTKTLPSKIFIVTTILMFIVATSHIAVNLYRLLRGYVWLREDPGPVVYFSDLGRWDNIAHDAINGVMTWLGDFLLIYRCFIVWDNNYYIIILPSLLLICSIMTNSVALHLFTLVRLGTLFSPTLIHWMDSIYAIALAQNTVTTGLIAYRIWRQDRASRILGYDSTSSSHSLRLVIRIIVESAVIYVLTAILIIILYARNNNFQFVVQEAIVPMIGIVFTLITVRLAMSSSKAFQPTSTFGGPGTWKAATQLTEGGEIEVMPGGDVSTVGINGVVLKSLEFTTPLESMFYPEESQVGLQSHVHVSNVYNV